MNFDCVLKFKASSFAGWPRADATPGLKIFAQCFAPPFLLQVRCQIEQRKRSS